jgi:hypothetical protein
MLAECVALLRPGTPGSALYERALEVAAEAGYAEHFMGAGDGRVRFVGHCIGLELNEPPYLARGYAHPLESGNVVAVEPKLAFTGLGAVGVENSYLVAEDGPVQLTGGSEEALIVINAISTAVVRRARGDRRSPVAGAGWLGAGRCRARVPLDGDGTRAGGRAGSGLQLWASAEWSHGRLRARRLAPDSVADERVDGARRRGRVRRSRGRRAGGAARPLAVGAMVDEKGLFGAAIFGRVPSAASSTSPRSSRTDLEGTSR